jgi:hypothetical protein
METDFQSIFAARIVAGEKLGNDRREHVTLERKTGVARFIDRLMRLFQ